ncbi:TIGR02444 family protein [Desertibaculum subflavum]|uniref:TIGR02444 family protein n=1 Tax=Desertibaculum subflavum TaxID=2268458 RepID=UPI0013C513AF
MPKTKKSTSGAGLWRFSLRLYRRRGVADACLALQDRHGIDVNLLLYAAYAAVSGRGAVDAGALAAANRAIEGWRLLVILPLRRLRGQLKGVATAAPARKRVLAAELEAEKEAQRRLAGLLGPRQDRTPEARRGDLAVALAAVAGRARPKLGTAGRKAIATIARAARAELDQRRRRVGPLVSPQRRTRPASRPNRSSTRPTE